MMARRTEPAPEAGGILSFLTSREGAKTVRDYGLVIVLGYLAWHGMNKTIPTFLAMMKERDTEFKLMLDRRDGQFTDGLKAQGDRAVEIIKDQQTKFTAELQQQRADYQKNTDRLAQAIDGLKDAINQKGDPR